MLVVNLCKVLDEKPGVSRTLAKQLKEARETRYWLRLLIATELLEKARLSPLLNEAEEIIKIIAAIVVKTKRNRSK